MKEETSKTKKTKWKENGEETDKTEVKAVQHSFGA